MNRTVDSERSALYAAETAAFDGTDLETKRGYAVVQGVANDVITGEWWPGPTMEIRQARSDARSSSTICAVVEGAGAVLTIRFAADQTTVATAAHELAHGLAGVDAGHGAVFRRALLDVVAVITNLESTDRRYELHTNQLEQAFNERNLDIGERHWAQPAGSDIGPIAL